MNCDSDVLNLEQRDVVLAISAHHCKFHLLCRFQEVQFGVGGLCVDVFRHGNWFRLQVSEPLKGFLVKDVRRYSLQMFIC